jgi:hypothetical protein
MKTLLHLHPHSGCSTAEHENYFSSSGLLCLDIFFLGHCVTWESESEGGFMKIYSQWENVRVYRGIALVCVYTTSMAPSAYLWVYPTYVSLYHLYVSTNSTCLSNSTYLLYIHMSLLCPSASPRGKPQTAVGQITWKYRAWQALGILSQFRGSPPSLLYPILSSVTISSTWTTTNVSKTVTLLLVRWESNIIDFQDIILCHNKLHLDHNKRFQDCNAVVSTLRI